MRCTKGISHLWTLTVPGKPLDTCTHTHWKPVPSWKGKGFCKVRVQAAPKIPGGYPCQSLPPHSVHCCCPPPLFVVVIIPCTIHPMNSGSWGWVCVVCPFFIIVIIIPVSIIHPMSSCLQQWHKCVLRQKDNQTGDWTPRHIPDATNWAIRSYWDLHIVGIRGNLTQIAIQPNSQYYNCLSEGVSSVSADH